MPTLSESKTLICNSDFKSHSQFITPLLRFVIDIEMYDARADAGTSRFGGIPFMPRNFKWPAHKRGFHQFICQFNLEELPPNKILPNSGMLSFFAACDPEGDDWFWEDEYLHLHYFPDTRKIVELEPPEKVLVGNSFGLGFNESYDLPFNRCLRNDWPWDEDEHDDFQYVLGEEFERHDASDYLFGYAPSSSLAYNPAGDSGLDSLLTLTSDDELNWNWHDGGRLMVFGGQLKPKAGKINGKCDAG